NTKRHTLIRIVADVKRPSAYTFLIVVRFCVLVERPNGGFLLDYRQGHNMILSPPRSRLVSFKFFCSDVLFPDPSLDRADVLNEIMLRWNNGGSSWDNRADWGPTELRTRFCDHTWVRVLIGSVLILLGIGKLHQPAYLLVFFSIRPRCPGSP